jgi:hypothetical protein
MSGANVAAPQVAPFTLRSDDVTPSATPAVHFDGTCTLKHVEIPERDHPMTPTQRSS